MSGGEGSHPQGQGHNGRCIEISIPSTFNLVISTWLFSMFAAYSSELLPSEGEYAVIRPLVRYTNHNTPPLVDGGGETMTGRTSSAEDLSSSSHGIRQSMGEDSRLTLIVMVIAAVIVFVVLCVLCSFIFVWRRRHKQPLSNGGEQRLLPFTAAITKLFLILLFAQFFYCHMLTHLICRFIFM